MGFKVKPLVWQKSKVFGNWMDDWHTVPTGYTIRFADENGWKWQGAGVVGYASSPEMAKAAAQSDHEARIMACIEATQ